MGEGYPLCERCSLPLSLTKSGKLRRGKRFCSTACQQAEIKRVRKGAKVTLLCALERLECRGVEGANTIRDSLETLGVLRHKESR